MNVFVPEFNFTKTVDTAKEAEVVLPHFEIESIDSVGILTIIFSQEIKIPADLNEINQLVLSIDIITEDE